jgi:cell wall-associated NlpC family hydrolase
VADVRARALSFIGSLTIVVSGAPPALAASAGGVAPGVTTAAGSAAAKRPARKAALTGSVPPGAAPITSRSQNLSYSGPVYERAPSGEVTPYEGDQSPETLSSATGGSLVAAKVAGKPQLLVPGSLARSINGQAAAPMSAPAAVQQMIWAANQIIGLPYIYGGGHESFTSPGYDCSGTVSFALHGASLLSTPEDSSEMESYGSRGVGRWITVFANSGHAYVDVAGLRLDTSAADDPSRQQGPRWRPLRVSNGGYTIRHPRGL